MVIRNVSFDDFSSIITVIFGIGYFVFALIYRQFFTFHSMLK